MSKFLAYRLLRWYHKARKKSSDGCCIYQILKKKKKKYSCTAHIFCNTYVADGNYVYFIHLCIFYTPPPSLSHLISTWCQCFKIPNFFSSAFHPFSGSPFPRAVPISHLGQLLEHSCISHSSVSSSLPSAPHVSLHIAMTKNPVFS